ncbi:hypothetical protein TcasGA2_TC003267 [Tribolium castaneum]|uniref:Uncharacterized protein n=1 Tax=Tribolium castaneum TaxID=7070 RepID=D6WEH7_TRICA|nr:hypothetical protein TcasGA2_TC003267 [Tribolium castaneum]
MPGWHRPLLSTTPKKTTNTAAPSEQVPPFLSVVFERVRVGNASFIYRRLNSGFKIAKKMLLIDSVLVKNMCVLLLLLKQDVVSRNTCILRQRHMILTGCSITGNYSLASFEEGRPCLISAYRDDLVSVVGLDGTVRLPSCFSFIDKCDYNYVSTVVVLFGDFVVGSVE